MAMLVFCLYALADLAVIIMKVFIPAVAAADIITLLIDPAAALYLPWIILTVVTFYFGYYGLEKLKK